MIFVSDARSFESMPGVEAVGHPRQRTGRRRQLSRLLRAAGAVIGAGQGRGYRSGLESEPARPLQVADRSRQVAFLQGQSSEPEVAEGPVGRELDRLLKLLPRCRRLAELLQGLAEVHSSRGVAGVQIDGSLVPEASLSRSPRRPGMAPVVSDMATR